jgi:hypothetical protein
MTTIDHTRDRHLVVQGTQAACGWILHILLTQKHRVTDEDLPDLTWVIRKDEPRLAGQADTVEDLHTWAGHLNLPIAESRWGRELWTEAEGVLDGVEIRVWHRRIAPQAVA